MKKNCFCLTIEEIKYVVNVMFRITDCTALSFIEHLISLIISTDTDIQRFYYVMKKLRKCVLLS